MMSSHGFYMCCHGDNAGVSVCAERLVESLRLPQVPILHAQVFLFFRVLLLRMSPQHLTSLWPTMITELVSTSCCAQPPFFCSYDFLFPVYMKVTGCLKKTHLLDVFVVGSGVSADGAGANSG